MGTYRHQSGAGFPDRDNTRRRITNRARLLLGLPDAHQRIQINADRGHRMIYNRKELAILAYVAGLLTGMVVAFASCSANPDAANDHITTGAQK